MGRLIIERLGLNIQIRAQILIFLPYLRKAEKQPKNFKTPVDVWESPVMFPLAVGIDVRFIEIWDPFLGDKF